MKKKISKLAIIFAFAMVSLLLLAYAQSSWVTWRGAMVDQQWWIIKEAPDPYVADLLGHYTDVGGTRPEDIDDLIAHGFTIVSSQLIGQTFLFMNNRVWPFGATSDADETDPWNDEAVAMRKALARLVNKPEIVATLYTYAGIAETMSVADWWLPPGQELWTAMGQPYLNGQPNPHYYPVPTWDPVEAASILDAAGWVQGTTVNPDYDSEYPGSAQYMRIDPTTGEDMDTIMYAAVDPVECPYRFQMARMIRDWMRTAGIPCEIDPMTWDEMVYDILIDPDLLDYQLLTGIGITWGSTAPDILYDFTYSWNLPLWNIVYMNFSQADYWGLEMMATLNLTRMQEASFEIQKVLDGNVPYFPLLLWNNFVAAVGEEDPLDATWGPGNVNAGMIGIVNMKGIGLVNTKGQGVTGSGNVWTKLHSYSNESSRWGPAGHFNTFGMDSRPRTFNPLESDEDVEWQVLNLLMGSQFRITPYFRNYWWWAARDNPTVLYETLNLWIGPGSSKVADGDGVYNSAFNGTHYVVNGTDGALDTTPGEITGPITVVDDDVAKPIAQYVEDNGPYTGPYVTQDDLNGDDRLGAYTTWTLRNDMYWHDSDPGPDARFGTADDGAGPDDIVGTADDQLRHVTTADTLYAANLAMGKEHKAYPPGDPRYYENVRYCGAWQFFAGYTDTYDGPFAVTVVNAQTYKLYEERRYIFAFESHGFLKYVPEHIWKPWVDGPDGMPRTGDERNPHEWRGWEDPYKWDPVRDRLGLSPMRLTYLIGFGPFVFHEGGLDPGVSVHIETNPLYFGGRICPADVDLEVHHNPTLPPGKRYYGYVDAADLSIIQDARDGGAWVGFPEWEAPGDPHVWMPAADMFGEAQVVTGAAEISWWDYLKGDLHAWGPGYP